MFPQRRALIAAVLIAIVAGGSIRGAGQSASVWLDRFDVNKADLLPTGTNAYIQDAAWANPEAHHGRDTLTVTILPGTLSILVLNPVNPFVIVVLPSFVMTHWPLTATLMLPV